MVRAISGTPFSLTGFLERIRPGIAVSAALHAALFIALAYFLAFQPTVAPPADPDEERITVVTIPPPAQKPQPQVKTRTFDPTPTKNLDKFPTTVSTLGVPATPTFERRQTTVVTAQPPAPDIIKDPKPIFRGGLVYPDVAADRGIPGYVDFSFIIEPDGTVGNPQVIAEEPDGYGFAAAAKKAFAKWRFEPRYVNGKAVAWPAQIRVSFQLR